MFLKTEVRSLPLALVALVPPAIAQVSGQAADPTSYGMTSGRLIATAAAFVALLGVVGAGFILARPADRLSNVIRLGAIAGGLIGVGVGGTIVATSAGFGTGGGRAGAIVALVLGLVAITLCVLALVRSRRSV